MKTRITNKERDRLEILKARVSTMQRELDGLCAEAWIILFGQDTLAESIEFLIRLVTHRQCDVCSREYRRKASLLTADGTNKVCSAWCRDIGVNQRAK